MSKGGANSQEKGRFALVVAALGVVVACAGVLLARCALRSAAESQSIGAYRVQSCSMEPTFLGPRFIWTCPRCERRFSVSIDVDLARGERGYSDEELNARDATTRQNKDSAEVRAYLETVRSAVCPYCGAAATQTPIFEDGEIVELEENCGKLEPRRWDVVIFRDRWGRLAIKRIVGTPNERVSLVNGDVFVNENIATRPNDVVWRDAVQIATIDPRRSDERIDVVNATFIDEGESSRAVPTAISNESPYPRQEGSNIARVEFVRDFMLRFRWVRGANGATPLAILARRPASAFLLEYDENSNAVSLRSLPLFNGKTASGRSFEQLTIADFLNERRAVVQLESAIEETEPNDDDRRVGIALVDGELSFTLNDVERARFSTNDVDSLTTAPISEPFALLGPVANIWAIELYRDAHYSAPIDPKRFSREDATSDKTTESAENATPSSSGYYVLGDNSPVSIDSRFDAFGTIDETAIVGRVKIAPSVR